MYDKEKEDMVQMRDFYRKETKKAYMNEDASLSCYVVGLIHGIESCLKVLDKHRED